VELTALSQAWARLAAVHKDLKASGFVLVLDDGRFAQLRSDDPMPAASSIKTPVLLAAMEDVDHGLLRWNEPLTLTKEVVGAGSGWMGGSPLGTRYPVYEAAAEMIRVSDNTATNLLIKRLGGKASIDQRFRSLGLSATKDADDCAPRSRWRQHHQQPRPRPHDRPGGNGRAAQPGPGTCSAR
jgi:beta-lactamase class A